MNFPKLQLVSAFFTTSTAAFEICRIGDEVNVLDNDSMGALRKDNYALFSDDITVDAQAKLSNELISALDQELHKHVYTLLSFDHNGSRLFPSNLTSACDAETRVIASLYTNSNSNSPSSTPSTSEANGALANLQLCQQLEVQASIEWAVKQQSDCKVACDLSPNNPKYL